MDDFSDIDPNFEPQSRPRSCTWPTKRPNIGRKQETSPEDDGPMMLETTLEESSFSEQVMPDDMMNLTALSGVKREDQDDLSFPKFSSFLDSGNELLDSAYVFDQITDFGSMLSAQPASSLTEGSSQQLSFTKLETIPQGSAFSGSSYISKLAGTSQDTLAGTGNLEFAKKIDSGAEKQLQTQCIGNSLNSTANVVSKVKTSSRKNAWGNQSYADLITQAIESAPDKRLTLAQIYDWIVKNIEHFKDKGDSNSSAGWKVSWITGTSILTLLAVNTYVMRCITKLHLQTTFPFSLYLSFLRL